MIKCRVRDLKTKKKVAYEWVENGFWKTQLIGDHRIYSGTWNRRVNSQAIPGIREQFTGLTDKNKIEAYAGDKFVLYMQSPYDSEVPIRTEFVIEFRDGRWWADDITMNENSGSLYELVDESQFEVIGSVHDKQEDK